MILRVLMCILGLIGSLAIGCSNQSSVPISDAAQARQIAEKVLDAWKAGSTLEELKNQKPAIIVAEDLWRNNVSLVSYKIQGDGAMVGPNVRFKILLNYKGEGGKKVERSFNYLVTTVPAVTFFREEG